MTEGVYTPDMNDGTRVFVFGSNLAGVHGAGAAKEAKKFWGAKSNVGSGRTGMAYAIPTKSHWLRPALPLEEISCHVAEFLDYAKENPNLQFLVTRIGCGFAGYKDEDIKPMFDGAPANCVLPVEWKGKDK